MLHLYYGGLDSKRRKKKILICVDEISTTPDMVVLTLEFGGWLISGYPVFIVCTGLYENLIEIGNVRNKTFFRRGTSVEEGDYCGKAGI